MKKIIGILAVVIMAGAMPLQALDTKGEGTINSVPEAEEWRDCMDEYQLEIDLGSGEGEANGVFNDCMKSNDKEMSECCN